MRKAADGLGIMRRRADFVAATRDALKIGGPLIGLQLNERAGDDAEPRLGITVTKRVGCSVERSRMKRRLRAAAKAAMPGEAKPGCDYVLVARRAVLDAPFERLVADLAAALKRAHGRGGRRTGPRGPSRESGR
jgi:ribonuclease P protein component